MLSRMLAFGVVIAALGFLGVAAAPPVKGQEKKAEKKVIPAEDARVTADKKTALDKEAWALLLPAADPKKGPFTYQTYRMAEIYESREAFYRVFANDLRDAMERDKRGSGKNVKVEIAAREAAAKKLFERDLHELFVILVKYKESREALFLSVDEITAMLADRTIPDVHKKRLRLGPTKKGDKLPEAVPLK